MGALYQAEMMAAEHGLVPLVELPDAGDGERVKGVLTIGAARERIDEAPEDVRTLYLAAHRAVRTTHAGASEVSGHASDLGAIDDESAIGLLPVIPIIIALTVLGVASIIAGAWYLTKRVEVDGANARATSLSSDAIELVRSGKPVPKELWDVMRALASQGNDGVPWWVWGLGGVAVTGASVLAWRHYSPVRMVRVRREDR
jgi:hypothetical protein